MACVTLSATSSISALRNGANGRGMPGPKVTTAFPWARTSKQPLRGFSLLMTTERSGWDAFRSFSSFAARVLNTPHDLQCSISTTTAAACLPPVALFLGAPVLFLAALFADAPVLFFAFALVTPRFGAMA
eukprot:CAMPEP_0198239800 /NCGR_PEP_ID=MMETSP1446-20131203/5099_1 /TAXON_ID=1461542 ORGANISM="Unidentified sp, Strain CCMP2111" /NCGR_SAMPLE_ID=MMETSP1446 /ASSEMBLY_ACC=CAM_ASM_001112 /LENGTH=129 /DNA_ID=CAMNT_0043922443 /DNA_START=270 /DNA_END=655 /DNA_ORIENTATION=+